MRLDEIRAELMAMGENPTDPEIQHARADVLLREALELLGRSDISAAFEFAQEKAQFWYA